MNACALAFENRRRVFSEGPPARSVGRREGVAPSPYVIAVAFTLINSVLCLVVGVKQSVQGAQVLLWESILITLVVWCMGSIARSIDAPTWDVLVLPAAVLVLSVGLYLVQGNESSAGNQQEGRPHG